MAKISVADNNNGKFTSNLMEHWRKKGHEVRFEMGASEYLAQWCDLYYIDFWDRNINYLYQLYNGAEDVSRTPDWDNNKKPRIVCRALDWEIWVGNTRNQNVVDWIDKAICIAPHIETEMRKYANFGNKLKLIRPGVNLDKFTLKQKKTDGFQVGMVLGDMWWPKNHMAGLDIFTTLYNDDNRWRLHIRGQHEGGTDYWKIMYEHYLDSRGIRDVVTLYPQVEDMNLWYENIDILLHPSMKEAFCYAVGEAMAKGIKVICNNFYGAENIWPKEILYNTHDEAIIMFTPLPPPLGYLPSGKPISSFNGREYIEKNYSLERQLKETNEWLAL